MVGNHVIKVMSRSAGGTGAAVAAIAVPYTFRRTFMTRSSLWQALVVRLSRAILQALGTTIRETVQAAATLAIRAGSGGRTPDVTRWSRAAIAFDLASVGAGIAVQRLLEQRSDERLVDGDEDERGGDERAESADQPEARGGAGHVIDDVLRQAFASMLGMPSITPRTKGTVSSVEMSTPTRAAAKTSRGRMANSP